LEIVTPAATGKDAVNLHITTDLTLPDFEDRELIDPRIESFFIRDGKDTPYKHRIRLSEDNIGGTGLAAFRDGTDGKGEKYQTQDDEISEHASQAY
jgi:hypothetical protein